MRDGHWKVGFGGQFTPELNLVPNAEGLDSANARIANGGSNRRASDCEQLTVFQRTANWCTPLRNRPITAEEQRALNEKAHEIFALCKRTWAGFIHEPDPRTAMDVPKEERLARYQELYDRGGFALWPSFARKSE